MLRQAHALRARVQHGVSTFTLRSNYEERAAQELAQSLSERISRDTEACTLLAASLDDACRRKLLKALALSESQASDQMTSVDGLFDAYDTGAPHDLLDRREFQAALIADRAARKSSEAAPAPVQPSSLAIGLASSIPFIGMGAVDNSIMLVAGSEIDAVFGAKLGLSTLAAAGLGNMVSDIAGVSMANRIESLTRKSKWIDAAAYKAGSRTPNGRAAKLTGAILGVSLGCLIGMAPLLFMETHEHS